MRPISTEARGEHLCLQKLLLDKSSRPSPSPHKPSELLQLGRPGLKNTFNTDVFIDLFYWSGEGCCEINASTIQCWYHVQQLQTGCAGQIPVPGLRDRPNYDSAEKAHEYAKVKNFVRDTQGRAVNYADEVQVEEKRVFMQKDGSCVKNEGRRNNVNPHFQFWIFTSAQSHLNLNVDHKYVHALFLTTHEWKTETFSP